MIGPPIALSAGRDVSELVPTLLVGLLYAGRAHALAQRDRAVERWRQVCFYAGLLVVAVAVLVLDHPASVSLAWRIAQLFLIGDVATLLFVAGLTAPLLGPLLRTRAFDRLRVLSSPPLAFALWTANLYLWLLSPLYQASLEIQGLQVLEHLCFVVFGINMWVCLFGPLPTPRWFANGARLVYVLAVRLGAIVLANLFLWSGKLFSSHYIQPDSARHISPLVDQNVAGAIMLVEGVLITLALLGWLYRQTLREVQAPARVFDFEREMIREFSRGRARGRPARVPARDRELRRRRFEPGGERPTAVPQPEFLDSR